MSKNKHFYLNGEQEPSHNHAMNIQEETIETPEVVEEKEVVEEAPIEVKAEGVETEVVEEAVEETVEENEEELSDADIAVKGKVTCEKLYVRSQASKDSEALCVLDQNTEVIINDINASEDFYKVIGNGFEGFCMKKFINIIEE